MPASPSFEQSELVKVKDRSVLVVQMMLQLSLVGACLAMRDLRLSLVELVELIEPIGVVTETKEFIVECCRSLRERCCGAMVYNTCILYHKN